LDCCLKFVGHKTNLDQHLHQLRGPDQPVREILVTKTAQRYTALAPGDPSFIKQLAGFSLTTAEIIYRLPDYPDLLQSFIWQDYDQAPRFPKLRGFLDFWRLKLDGKLFQVTVAHCALIRPAELRLIGAEFKLH
jgi:uncharacterized protein Usg